MNNIETLLINFTSEPITTAQPWVKYAVIARDKNADVIDESSNFESHVLSYCHNRVLMKAYDDNAGGTKEHSITRSIFWQTACRWGVTVVDAPSVTFSYCLINHEARIFSRSSTTKWQARYGSKKRSGNAIVNAILANKLPVELNIRTSKETSGAMQ